MSLSSPLQTANFYQLTDYQMELKDYGDASVYRYINTQSRHSYEEPPPPYSQKNSLYPALDDCVRMEFSASHSDHVQVPEYVAIIGLQQQAIKKFGYSNPGVSRSSPNLAHMTSRADCVTNIRGLSGTRNSLMETKESVQDDQGNKSQERVLQKMKEAHLVKNKEGKFGLTTSVFNKHVFVYNVKRGSPADTAGIKFGDQIFKVNGIEVSGLTLELVNDIFRQSPNSGASIIYRSRSDHPVFKKEFLKQQLLAVKKAIKISTH